ncbi:sensor histidine kinase [Paraflavitalea pollutisoli]|uniref:sensor histidine kinase n=1 Tax=Paraflavitalea pollutisoli TaxID=3034143 RepID=UPI0023EB1983|nr:sensor histidine kinase [Paraflavitalea sp. H1-2-19X]
MTVNTHSTLLRLSLPQYTRKDLWIFAAVVPVIVLVYNSLIFGNRYFSEGRVFVWASLSTLLIISGFWFLFTRIAVLLRYRFPHDNDLMKRMVISIFLFILINALIVTILFWGYDYFHFLNYELNQVRYQWTLLSAAIFNVFVTILHEGVDSFDKWKKTMLETQQLKKEYLQSRLLGLKSQMNPHFLFNSLNSLSSLIGEDTQAAEKFLDEMSKVYRYLLRSDDKFVTLDTELQFLDSYSFLLKVRYGDGIHINRHITAAQRKLMMPPLTLQLLVENTFTNNTISKESPLVITISSLGEQWMQIQHNVQPKIRIGIQEGEDLGLENVVNKYRLLSGQAVTIRQTEKQRVIHIPLIDGEETLAYE